MSATNRGTIRQESDFYPTPRSAFHPLLPFLPRDAEIWEPAQGDGRLVLYMRRYGLRALGADLNSGYDFLSDATARACIVTNPPFSLALEFCSHALEVSSEVFLLLRLNFLGSQNRKQWWVDHEPRCLFVLSRRPSFTGNNTDATEYAWFYWGSRHHGIRHL